MNDGPRALTLTQRLALLDDLAALHSDADGNVTASEVLRSFLPLSVHARALYDRILVVSGQRGAGKTALFPFLRAATEKGLSPRDLLGDTRISDAAWIEGFSENSQRHPYTDVLVQFGAEKHTNALRAFWLGSLAGVLADHGLELPPIFGDAWRRDLHEPHKWLPIAQLQLGPLTAALDRLDQQLARAGRQIVVTYDNLDRLKLTGEGPQRYTAALVDLWQSLTNRLKSIRCKLFLRYDLLSQVGRDWPDASKLLARAVDLTWEDAGIFQLFARVMGAQSEGLRQFVIEAGVRYRHHPQLGELPDTHFAEEEERRALMSRLAGKMMGSGTGKGYTDRWILARSRDGRGALSPRAAVRILALAAQHRRTEGGAGPEAALLGHRDLVAGVQRASPERVLEVAEEHPVIDRLELLRNREIPVTRDVVLELMVQTPREGGSAEADLAKLEEIGAVAPHGTGEDVRYDVPDIYRFHYGISRKGGPQLPTRPSVRR